jgi:hypothetical protein
MEWTGGASHRKLREDRCKRPKGETMEGSPGSRGRKNRLADSLSPYLIQHAENPVDWYPWCEEAFERARAEDRPVFLSIGYSTCHWCHVMAHESFEDPEVARLMNEAFVCIKVDREERPDLDGLYMEVCQMMTGSGGWPLNLILTPDKKPFFAATYIPKRARGGRIGMTELIPRIVEAWNTRREDVLKAAENVLSVMKQWASIEPGKGWDEALTKEAYNQLLRGFDGRFGGFGQSPKFPTPHNLLFLLRHWRRTGESKALEMVERTLDALHMGGIHDHVGFGFHRYSTDRMWHLPHFEKMLYDQALIAMAYTEAYRATKKEVYAKVAQGIFQYVLRDMTDPQGGFYCAEDADSDGMEGRFYLWSEDEIRAALPEREAEMAIKVFNVLKDGNYMEEATGGRTGLNVLDIRRPLGETAQFFGMDEWELLQNMDVIREKLFQQRSNRKRPHLDDKVLSDWNGLMIAAMAKGARAFGDDTLREAAERAVEFILGSMRGPQGELLHQWRRGEAGVGGMLDDYAFLTWALIELYETSFRVDHLEMALELHQRMMDEFWDEERGGFFLTSNRQEATLVRRKEIYDGAVPSGNSVAMYNLIRLARITGRGELEDLSFRTGEAFCEIIKRAPMGHTMAMVALETLLAEGCEMVVAGELGDPRTKEMFREISSRYLPFTVCLHRPIQQEEASRIIKIAPLCEPYLPRGEGPTAYICKGMSCQSPVTELDELVSKLEGTCI